MLRRQMEVYAGFMEFTDHHVGRLFDALEDLERARRHARLLHRRRQRGLRRGHAERHVQRDDQLQRRGRAGDAGVHDRAPRRVRRARTPTTTTRSAGRTRWTRPYQWTKQVASHFGGTRNGTIVHWPAGFDAQGEIRTQFTHVIDIAPTVLDAAGLVEPKFVNGVQQTPMQGVSMRYAFDDAAAAERHETQYFEMFGNRGIYHKGWTAVTRHKTPWLLVGEQAPAFDDDVWELYDTERRLDAVRGRLGAASRPPPRAPAAVPDRGDPQQRPAARRPRRGAALPGGRRPADARQGQPAAALRRHGPPDGELGRQHQEHVARGDGRDRRARGRRAGRDHRPGRQHRRLEPVRQGRPAALLLQPARRPALLRRQRRARSRPGTHQVRMEFDYDGPGLGKGGTARAVPRRRAGSARAPSPRRRR